MKLKKTGNNNLRILALIMLLLYIGGIAPSFIYHHHHSDKKIVAYSEADSCEKAIFYDVQDRHYQHVSEYADNCWFCDHHTVTPQIVYNYDFDFIPVWVEHHYNSFYLSRLQTEQFAHFNKGPPLISVSIS